MIKYLLIGCVVLLSGCSFSSPPNEWKYKSASAFESYKKNFLSLKQSAAKNDLSRAISHAKQSADLKHLSRVYLAKCALNFSVGIENGCKEYIQVQPLVEGEGLKSYYSLISNSLKPSDIKNLPKTYQDFARAYLDKDLDLARRSIFKMDTLTSKLIACKLIENVLDENDIQKLLKEVSFYGFKRSAIYWLEVLREKTNERLKKSQIEKKINILKS